MDRLPVNNMHLSQTNKVPSANDNLPTTSRQVAKNWSRPNNNNNNNNKPTNKNGYARYPNQTRHQRGREPKSTFAQHFRENVDTGRSYLADTRPISYRKKNVNTNGKVNIKERFVQANCQLVMAAINDNVDHLVDPDLPISWELVEEVLFTVANNELCCPICLCHPTAAKITRCGHIYCWSCILHYLALSDKESRSCPICFETIKKSELKSVTISSKVDYATNDYLTFSLMKIPKNSTVALPANYETDEPLNRLKRNVSQTLDQFGKIFTASPEYLSALFEREKNELAKQLLEYKEENMPEVCFVQSASELLEKRQREVEQLNSLCQQFAALQMPAESHTAHDDYLYFYQSEDGQPIYLHSINVRMLKHEFGELKNCPATITAKIIDLQWESVHDEMRRRYAHLRHLPLSCEFKIAELEFDTSVVSQITLDHFALEIINRKKSRKRKERAQKIRDHKIEIENKRKIYGISPAPTFQLDNANDFPDYLASEAEPSIGIESNEISSPFPEPELGSSPPSSAGPGDFQSSFARMLSTGGGHQFNNTLRKKPSSSVAEQQLSGMDKSGDEADSGMTMQSMNITLGDFFDNCIKTSKKKDRKARKK